MVFYLRCVRYMNPFTIDSTELPSGLSTALTHRGTKQTWWFLLHIAEIIQVDFLCC